MKYQSLERALQYDVNQSKQICSFVESERLVSELSNEYRLVIGS